MTLVDIANRYYSSTGRVLYGGTDNGAVVLPFILMEIARDAFQKDIEYATLVHRSNSIRNDWARYNNMYFRELGRQYPGDEYNEMLDVMDEVQEFCSRQLTVLRVQIMNALDDVDFEHQKVLASAQLANIMSQEAEDLWEAIFRTHHGQREQSHYMKSVRRYSCLFTGEYFKQVGGTRVNFNESDNIIAAVKALENRILLWFRQRYEAENTDKISN